MRSYCSLYVDAGYLMAASSTRVTGTSLRSATEMDVASLLSALTKQVEVHSGLPLLRIHWYDAGTRAGAPGGNQKDIATIPKVKLRLGRISFNGEQKGVDLKLALDLITQSRNRVAEIVYLVSGDDDLSEAVEEAQHLGVQVIGLVVPDQQGEAIAASKHLQMTVDQMLLIDDVIVDNHVKKSTAAAMQEVAAAAVTPAAEPQAEPEVREPASLQVPSPALLAQRPHARPAATVAPAAPAQAPLYSTTTGVASTGSAVAGLNAPTDEIGDVVDKVVINWWRSASALSRQELLQGKPIIPAELDRALLNDLSNKLNVYDIPQDWRFVLRDEFWAKISRL
ncbi:MAG: NYN domain-containing protein [Mycobacteriales bacterium]|nr:NYN domain-containing protein [Mycobacteriales bacterium]